ncbi:MAG: ArsR/SmtB family transcription factor, partial [Actinomycetota bacterium]
VVELLRAGERSVGDLAGELPVSRPAVSQHLRVLKGAGLVTERHEGTRHLYAIDPSGLGQLRAYLDSFWDGALASFKETADVVGGEPARSTPAAGPTVGQRPSRTEGKGKR